MLGAQQPVRRLQQAGVVIWHTTHQTLSRIQLRFDHWVSARGRNLGCTCTGLSTYSNRLPRSHNAKAQQRTAGCFIRVILTGL